MSDIVVFVDDAVRGSFPDVCAKDGVPARGRLRVVGEIGRSNRIGILWLLLFAGPPGWIVLLVLAASRNPAEQLVVKIPYSDTAYARLLQARRRRNLALAIGSLGGAGLLLLTAWAHLGVAGFALALGVAGAALVVVVIAEYRVGAAAVGMRLDASRRWVTLRGVHPAFASAYTEQEQQRTVTTL